jgi:hypothetical protein
MTDFTDDEVHALVRVIADGCGRASTDGAEFPQMLAHEILRAGYRFVDPAVAHMIDFREDGWTLSHPLSCRAGGQTALFECSVNRLAGATFVQAPPILGRFPISVDETGKILTLGDRVES